MSIIDLEVNHFDYGKNKDTDIHSKVFINRYIPLRALAPPKPEFIIWQNLDFVNRRIGLAR